MKSADPDRVEVIPLDLTPGDGEPPTSRTLGTAFAMLTYVVAVGAFLLYWNAQAGGLVEGWHAEYGGAGSEISGSGKWRTAEGKSFQNTALLLGIWIYPLSVLTAVTFARQTWSSSGVARRLISLACAVLPLYILYRLLKLGLFTAVTSF